MQLPAERLEQARRGDRAAIEALSGWCLRTAFRLAYLDLRSLPNRQAVAEEIAGEASLRAIQALDQFQPGTRFEAWLHQIVRNCVRYRYRRENRPVPQPIYQRWVHDFVAGYLPDLEALIQRELGHEPSAPHPLLLQQIAAALGGKSYLQFMALSYGGRAQGVLETVQDWLRAFVGLEEVPLYETDDGGEWVGVSLIAEDETEAQVLRHEFVQEVNERLAELMPLCRRFLRWYYLDQLRVPEIAGLEQMSERSVYRRIESCSAAFRARLMRDGYFAEFAAKREVSR